MNKLIVVVFVLISGSPKQSMNGRSQSRLCSLRASSSWRAAVSFYHPRKKPNLTRRWAFWKRGGDDCKPSSTIATWDSFGFTRSSRSLRSCCIHSWYVSQVVKAKNIQIYVISRTEVILTELFFYRSRIYSYLMAVCTREMKQERSWWKKGRFSWVFWYISVYGLLFNDKEVQGKAGEKHNRNTKGLRDERLSKFIEVYRFFLVS